MPPTVDGLLLLGWMEKDEAIRWLTKDCYFDPALTEERSIELWQKYKKVVEALPERKPEKPTPLPIPPSCKSTVDGFMSRVGGPEVLDVININPVGLLVYQLYVVADRADHHAQQLGGLQWARTCLQLDRPTAQMPGRMEGDTIKINLPHAEHMFGPSPTGGFQIEQGGGFISVCEVEGRMLLKAGYHRSFAFARSRMKEPDAKDRSLFVAVTKTVPPQLLPTCPTQGLRTTVLGSRSPLLSDFFEDSLAMAVKLRKKRYEMHIKVNVVPIDEA
jgi:hypothetical protein